MADKKPNISEEKVRVPPELMAELRRTKGEAQIRGERPPDFGQLLWDAWRAFKSIANSGDSSALRKNRPEGNIQPLEPVHTKAVHPLNITSEDEPWIEKLLQVRHSRKPGLRRALENNLHMFAWADAAYSELEQHQSPLVSSIQDNPRADRSIADPGEHARVAGDRDPGTGDPAPYGDIDNAIDAIEERQRERQQRAKRTPRKAG